MNMDCIAKDDCCQTDRQPEVRGAMNALETVAARLEETTQQLLSRCEGVLSPPGPCKNIDPTPEDYSSPIASDISRFVKGIQSCVEALADASRRCEL